MPRYPLLNWKGFRCTYRRRILIGDDAHKLDQAVRASPEQAYEEGGMQQLFESQVRCYCCAERSNKCCDLGTFA